MCKRIEKCKGPQGNDVKGEAVPNHQFSRLCWGKQKLSHFSIGEKYTPFQLIFLKEFLTNSYIGRLCNLSY